MASLNLREFSRYALFAAGWILKLLIKPALHESPIARINHSIPKNSSESADGASSWSNLSEQQIEWQIDSPLKSGHQLASGPDARKRSGRQAFAAWASDRRKFRAAVFSPRKCSKSLAQVEDMTYFSRAVLPLVRKNEDEAG